MQICDVILMKPMLLPMLGKYERSYRSNIIRNGQEKLFPAANFTVGQQWTYHGITDHSQIHVTGKFIIITGFQL